MSIFAPQAYTKETLSKAFEWLQHQPSSIQQAAANPDMLVSIYLQAQRQGLQKLDADAPVSSRKFIDDLKTLSRDFAQFDDPPTNAKASLQSTAASTHKTYENSAPAQAAPTTLPPLPVRNKEQLTGKSSPTTDHFFSLDEKSLNTIRQFQERFHLSTSEEALRMVIAMGIEKISSRN